MNHVTISRETTLLIILFINIFAMVKSIIHDRSAC